MFAFFFGVFLTVVSPPSVADLDACLAKAPAQSDSPIAWGNVNQMWTDDPPASPETVRSYLFQFREARECFLHLDPSEVSRSYLDNIMRTFAREAVLLAGLRRFPDAFDVFEAGQSFLERELSIPSREDTRTAWRSTLHQNQGYLHYLLGDLSASIDSYLKAYESTPPEETAQRTDQLRSIGVLQQRTQDYQSAHHYYERAEQLFRESDLSTETHPSLWVRTLHVQADLLLEQTLNTRFDRDALLRARDLARQARQVAEPGTEQHTRVTMALSESLGYLDNFDEAYRLNEEARRYTSAHGKESLHTFALLKLGILHTQTGRWTEAERVLTRSLEDAESLGNFDYQRRILRDLGRLFELQERWAEAETYYRRGVAVVEAYRESLTASKWSMTAFSQWQDVHRGLVRTLLAQDRSREALSVLDRTRGRHLQDLRTQALVADELPPDQRVRLDSLTRALTEVRNQLGKEPASPSVETNLRNREAELMAARREILEIDSATTRPEISQVKKTLAKQNRGLLSYFIDEPWPIYDRPSRSAAFLLTDDSLHVVSLEGVTQGSIREQIEAASSLFSTSEPSTRTQAMHFDLRPLQELQEAIYAPVAEHLADGQPLTVVPDGPLFHIPFSLLVRSTPGGRYDPAAARFLLHERATSLELASSLAATTDRRELRRSSSRDKLFAFGVSEFDMPSQSVPTALRSSLPDSSLTLPSLPGVRSELEAVHRRVGNAETVLDDDATETAFREASRHASVLHLASHAFVHPSNPLHNAFLLRPDSSQEENDGVLFLHELQAQTDQIPFVVLSGCSTARGTLRSGEGMEGLQYAFRAMGTQATLATLWPVADEVNADLMETFYQNLQEGLPKDEALRQAKLSYLETHPDQSSPFFWGAPALYGSPSPLDLDAPSLLPPGARWPLGLTGLLFLAGLLRWWTKGLPIRLRGSMSA